MSIEEGNTLRNLHQTRLTLRNTINPNIFKYIKLCIVHELTLSKIKEKKNSSVL